MPWRGSPKTRTSRLENVYEKSLFLEINYEKQQKVENTIPQLSTEDDTEDESLDARLKELKEHGDALRESNETLKKSNEIIKLTLAKMNEVMAEIERLKAENAQLRREAQNAGEAKHISEMCARHRTERELANLGRAFLAPWLRLDGIADD